MLFFSSGQLLSTNSHRTILCLQIFNHTLILRKIPKSNSFRWYWLTYWLICEIAKTASLAMIFLNILFYGWARLGPSICLLHWWSTVLICLMDIEFNDMGGLSHFLFFGEDVFISTQSCSRGSYLTTLYLTIGIALWNVWNREMPVRFVLALRCSCVPCDRFSNLNWMIRN